jgi:hypothetical protein
MKTNPACENDPRRCANRRGHPTLRSTAVSSLKGLFS